jgi:arylsulfatase A-like enzyme
MGDKQRPNIIFVLIDTLRADRLSCCGYRKLTSPNMDKLAGAGLLFDNTIVSAPWTLPSHASLFTGLFPYEHGATDENPYLRDDVPTVAELLNESGYFTVAHALGNGWLSNDTNLMRGFRHFYGPTYYAPPRATGSRLLRKIRWKVRTTLKLDTKNRLTNTLDAVEGYLNKHQTTGKPLFFFLHLMETHMPYRPSERAMHKFGLDKVDPQQIEYLQQNFREFRAIPEKMTPEQLRILSDMYDACISTVDSRLGRLFRLVRKTEHRDNTVLIITSDHGEQLGEHGIVNHWLSLYDVLLKVPLIMWGPGKFAVEKRITQQVQHKDLFYTLLDIAGYDGQKVSREKIKDKSLLEMAAGANPFPEYTFAQQAYAKLTLEHIRKYNPSFSNETLVSPKQAVRTNRFKYIKYGTGLEELFDIVSDPQETKNVIDEFPEAAQELREKLSTLPASAGTGTTDSTRLKDFDPQVKKQLEDLGYL